MTWMAWCGSAPRRGFASPAARWPARLRELAALVDAGALDVLQPDAVLAVGILRARELAKHILPTGLWFTPHTWTNGIGLLANLHLAAGVGGGPFLELPFDPPGWTPDRRDFMLAEPVRPNADGVLAVPDRPGSRFRARRGGGRAVHRQLTMTTFDVHQHFLPPQLVDELRARREPPLIAGSSLELGEGAFPFEERDNDLGERIALLDRDGIDVALISLAADDGHRRQARARGGLQRGHPRGRGGRRWATAGVRRRRCLDGLCRCLRLGAAAGGRPRRPARRARPGRTRCCSSIRAHRAPPRPMRLRGGRESSTTRRRCRPRTSRGSTTASSSTGI